MLCHYKRRALLKKLKRKSRRQALAQEREADELKELEKRKDSTSYWEELAAEEAIEAAEEERRKREEQEWLRKEAEAQEIWKKKQDKILADKRRREDEERRIREEWEARKSEEDAKRIRQEDLLKEATANEKQPNDSTEWHNPFAPDDLEDIRDDREACLFFKKTGACRFGIRCSRRHDVCESSCILLFPAMFINFSLEKAADGGRGQEQDFGLEVEESDLDLEYEEFYEDVVTQFRQYGRVLAMFTCRNHATHLRGNVYLEYGSESEACTTLQRFRGRWYGGRQLSCHFVDLPSWKEAICGLHQRKRCPKGDQCNFLHVFPYPNEVKQFLWTPRTGRQDSFRSRRGESERSNRTRERRPYDNGSRNGDSWRSSRHNRREISETSHRSMKENRDNSPRRSQSRSSVSNRRNRNMDRSRSRSRSPDMRSSRKNRSRSRSRSRDVRSSRKNRSKSRSRSPDMRSSRKIRSRSRSRSRDMRSSRKNKSRSRSRSPDMRSCRSKKDTSRSEPKSNYARTNRNKASRSGSRSPDTKNKDTSRSRSRSGSKSPETKNKDTSRSSPVQIEDDVHVSGDEEKIEKKKKRKKHKKKKSN